MLEEKKKGERKEERKESSPLLASHGEKGKGLMVGNPKRKEPKRSRKNSGPSH